MAKTITLTQTASPNTAITINAPAYPEMRGESYPMIYGRTMGGGIKVADLGPGTATVYRNPSLAFDRLSNTQYESLRNFIKTTVQYSKTSFTYTDPFSTSHTNMHYTGGLEGFRSSVGNFWSGTITLAKDMNA
jgi:hypothetical protein